jgi:hypothetical protein
LDAVAERCSDLGEKVQSWVYVHMKFSKAMPVGQVEQELENAFVMGFRQEAIKNRYSTL